MIILGIDPGSRLTGYGLIEKKGQTLKHIDNGLIACKATDAMSIRLAHIFRGIQKIITEFAPDCVAIENIFVAKNIQSTFKLGQARGTAIVAAALLDKPVHEYSPMEVKKAVAGFGGAPKEQVQKMVRALLALPQIAEENASDALGIAICHAHSMTLKKILMKNE